MEKFLVKKNKELDICDQELREEPLDKLVRRNIVQAQRMVWLIEDTIQRVKDDTYYQR